MFPRKPWDLRNITSHGSIKRSIECAEKSNASLTRQSDPANSETGPPINHSKRTPVKPLDEPTGNMLTIFFSTDYSLRIRSHFGDKWNLNAKILSVSHPWNQGAIYIQTLDLKLLSWMSSLNLYLHHHMTNTQISLNYMVLHTHQLNPLLYLLTGFRNYYWI